MIPWESKGGNLIQRLGHELMMHRRKIHARELDGACMQLKFICLAETCIYNTIDSTLNGKKKGFLTKREDVD